ncbi:MULTISPECIES: hypothetical protein [unclassified Devosia]|uniref:hypothetical protein n=1 Tax=unclassified Devosia TaxID=196773 RepID=UPI00086B366F|nr:MULTISPECIES: hypothetical protein [unclassified Devosia]MBN9362189.1 hypothetical protein [Devosia sp.]ODS94053.1 MAG: hypothetical protein ABS47_06720 [Devosia sp. SCN 66-27]OJX24556.1 MAG: hypothetical protein BGO83_08040 [Devosia sp. 66-14]
MPSLKLASLILAVAATLAVVAPAAAQSLSPLEKTGVTPSDRKAFKLTVGNPYQSRMTFVMVPLAPDYQTPIEGVTVRPAELTMAPQFSRQVIVTFDIDPKKKERTIALCVMPKALDGPILPRVCGRYTGRMAGNGG